MRKILILLVVILLMCASGCGKGENTIKDSVAKEATQEPVSEEDDLAALKSALPSSSNSESDYDDNFVSRHKFNGAVSLLMQLSGTTDYAGFTKDVYAILGRDVPEEIKGIERGVAEATLNSYEDADLNLITSVSSNQKSISGSVLLSLYWKYSLDSATGEYKRALPSQESLDDFKKSARQLLGNEDLALPQIDDWMQDIDAGKPANRIVYLQAIGIPENTFNKMLIDLNETDGATGCILSLNLIGPSNKID